MKINNWKTTASGIGSILASVAAVLQDPSNITKPEVIASFLAGIGLLVAADGKKA